MNELKPCPFCGGKAYMRMVCRNETIEKFPDKADALEKYPAKWWVLGCLTPGCILEANPEKHFIKLGFRAGSEKEAVEKWNKRAEE